ncbi:MAG: hypothetical protein WCK57_05535 [Verrucomicrobiae bacterium]
MKTVLAIVLLAFAAVGCTTKSKSQLQAQRAYLAGQNAALKQQLTQQAAGVTIIGAVQNSQVPWVAGLTLAQAVATANYIGAHEPKGIIITRQGESAALEVQDLFNGANIPLEVGDVIELR